MLGILDLSRWGLYTSLLAKEELLTVLLENEQTRLAVWLNPLGGGTNSVHKDPSDVSLLVLLNPLIDVDITSGHPFKYIKDSLGRQPLYSSASDEEIPLAKASQ